MDREYIDTVRLLLDVAPDVFPSGAFAMKGGTALNLFVQDMPRLSVDIDVVFVDRNRERKDALVEIESELQAVKERLVDRGLKVEITATKEGNEAKLLVSGRDTRVKVEVNHVFRGTVLPVESRRMGKNARDLFTTDLTLPILSVSELYGSKLVAALDRQHPRDLFDVIGMFQQLGLTPEIVECFVCYLAGHNRPMHEVLFSRDLNIATQFESEFEGMTKDQISVDDLVAIRAELRKEMGAALTGNQKRFLLSLAQAKPIWNLMDCEHLAELPAIRWKLQYLEKLRQTNPKKFRLQTDELQRGLEL